MSIGSSLFRSLLILLALALLQSAQAAGLTAEPDRTQLGANETLSLRVIAEGRLSGDPDLSPLEKDFEVLNRSTSSRMTIVNGSMSQTREWVLELAPRRTGELQIPALSLGGERTSPIRVQVLPADQAAARSGPKSLFLDTLVDDASPYVQQSFTYRVKVIFLEQPRRATLSDPVADGATMEQRGDDQSYTEMIDGRRYTVIERRYLVVPQRSGPLTIRAPRLEAVLPDNRPGARRSPFADFEDAFGGRIFQGFPALPDLGSGRRVVERGPDRTVDVRPQPPNAGQVWLPAESVELSDEWTQSPPRFRVGEPITRTLTITARGVTAAQLPTLDTGAPDGVNVYPEQPETEDLPGAEVPAALKTLKVALVPTRAGALTLPEIRLPWWDTAEDRARVAVIPQRTVQVEPGSAPAPTLGSAPASEPAPAVLQTQGPSEPVREGGAAAPTPSAPAHPKTPLDLVGSGIWPWIALVLGLGWLLTLVWLMRGRRLRQGPRQSADSPPKTKPRRQTVGDARSAVRRASTAGDPRALRDALLAWGGARWPDDAPGGLSALAARLNGPEAEDLLQGIDRAIYAPAQPGDAEPLDGAALWRRLEPLLDGADTDARRTAPSGPLPELYPKGV